ncbi:MAG: DUF6538 domain-containing protein, partial [Pseudomonadota bacterium]
MSILENMPGHTRLYRRGAVYYHRAAIPKDIADTYPKAEETFSLKTKDHAEALRRVRVEAVRVDQKFAAHRRRLEAQNAPCVEHVTPEQLKTIKQVYLHHLLEEDEEIRLDGFEEPEAIIAGEETQEYDPRPSFEERQELIEDMDAVTRGNLARGKQDEFFKGEAEEVLSWEGIEVRLSARSDPHAIAWQKRERFREPCEPPQIGELIQQKQNLLLAFLSGDGIDGLLRDKPQPWLVRRDVFGGDHDVDGRAFSLEVFEAEIRLGNGFSERPARAENLKGIRDASSVLPGGVGGRARSPRRRAAPGRAGGHAQYAGS